MSPLTSSSPGDSSAAAIRCLAEQGYEATTAEDLANAIGVSRSTFFRRFGSKDDVVFADHDIALAQLESRLGTADDEIASTLAESAAAVLRLLARDPEAARLRFELMRDTPALRDRELVITHRYERVFAAYLRRALPSETPAWVPASLAAGVVAVHNTTLRAWLTGDVPDAARTIEADLARMISLYDRWLSPGADTAKRRVLVAVYEAQGSPESVLDAVARRLDA
ncbi:TetR family transcriptional regulator [Leucobacter sp. gxy201]|uniref:TetR/AcrR family transcriptional regulator n=1 Tax=Leucobacter sp. gxy201 TaxID=2957200 RepID=UPI003DA12D98